MVVPAGHQAVEGKVIASHFATDKYRRPFPPVTMLQ